MNRKLIMLSLLAAGLASCSDYDWDTIHETELSSFNIKTDDIAVDLRSEETDPEATYTIEWERSKAADYSAVFYKVLFSATGDFDNYDYALEPAGIGTATSLELSAKTLNIIAEACGVEQNSSGSVKWTVAASNGINDRLASGMHTLTVGRPQGFAYIPSSVVVTSSTGEATMMKKTAEGVYEAFVYLADGDYSITDTESAIYSYGLTADAMIQNATFKSITPGKIHHVTVDFNTAEGRVASVEKVGLWYNGTGDILAEMTPADDRSARWNALFLFDPADGDLKYKFCVEEKTASGTTETAYYGYSSAISRPQTATSPASYFYLVKENGFTAGSYCYSLNTSLHKDKMLSVTVDMRPETETYFHTVTVR